MNASEPTSPYKETPASEVIEHMDNLFARYRLSHKQVKRRIYLTAAIFLILGFIGGNLYKGLVPKGSIYEVSKANKTSKFEHVKGYRP